MKTISLFVLTILYCAAIDTKSIKHRLIVFENKNFQGISNFLIHIHVTIKTII
jgi:hypothetical protein